MLEVEAEKGNHWHRLKRAGHSRPQKGSTKWDRSDDNSDSESGVVVVREWGPGPKRQGCAGSDRNDCEERERIGLGNGRPLAPKKRRYKYRW